MQRASRGFFGLTVLLVLMVVACTEERTGNNRLGGSENPEASDRNTGPLDGVERDGRGGTAEGSVPGSGTNGDNGNPIVDGNDPIDDDIDQQQTEFPPIPDELKINTLGDYVAHLASDPELQRTRLCQRGNRDRFAQWYCSGQAAPRIQELPRDVLQALRIAPDLNGNFSGFACLAHSASLARRSVNPCNARCIFYSEDRDDPDTPISKDYCAVAFNRGEESLEIICHDPVKGRNNFYFLRYEKSCWPNCSNYELYSIEAERNLGRVFAFPVEQFRNTPVDCLSCHRDRNLRMQQLLDPWTHFLFSGRQSRGLLQTFEQCHRGESQYAGIARTGPADDAPDVAGGTPNDLERFICRGVAGNGNQCEFLQSKSSIPDVTYDGDLVNREDPTRCDNALHESPGCRAVLQPGLQGGLPAPSCCINPFDANEVQQKSRKFIEAISGNPQAMPDMADLFAEQEKPYMFHEPHPSARTAQEIVRQACTICHASPRERRYIPSGGNRDSFVAADFLNISQEMAGKVCNRIRLPRNHVLTMPPKFFMDLKEQHIQTIERALGCR